MLIKVVWVIFAAAMVVQLIRPLGLPGLAKRSDAWKLAVVAFAIFAVVILIRPAPP